MELKNEIVFSQLPKHSKMEQVTMENFREKIGELWEYRNCPLQQQLIAKILIKFFDFMHEQYPIVHDTFRTNENGDGIYGLTLIKICQQGFHNDEFVWFLCSKQNWLFNSNPEYYYVLMDKKGNSHRVSYEEVYFYMQKLKLDFPAILSIFWHFREISQ